MIQGADTEGGRIELHCHLDGSVRPSTSEDLARRQGPESVREALDVLGAERIGHGVRAARDPAPVEHLAARRIVLECCPTSNVQTWAVARLADHPLDRLRRAGVPVTVSTDDRTVSGTTLTRELELVTRTFGWTAADHRACQQTAARASFASIERRRQLMAQLASD